MFQNTMSIISNKIEGRVRMCEGEAEIYKLRSEEYRALVGNLLFHIGFFILVNKH